MTCGQNVLFADAADTIKLSDHLTSWVALSLKEVPWRYQISVIRGTRLLGDGDTPIPWSGLLWRHMAGPTGLVCLEFRRNPRFPPLFRDTTYHIAELVQEDVTKWWSRTPGLALRIRSVP